MSYLRDQHPATSGWTVIGIRSEITGNGIRDTGLSRHIPRLTGTVPVMRGAHISRVIGQDLAAGSNTTTTGTMIEIATSEDGTKDTDPISFAKYIRAAVYGRPMYFLCKDPLTKIKFL
jgi:hypothetical protein